MYDTPNPNILLIIYLAREKEPPNFHLLSTKGIFMLNQLNPRMLSETSTTSTKLPPYQLQMYHPPPFPSMNSKKLEP